MKYSKLLIASLVILGGGTALNSSICFSMDANKPVLNSSYNNKNLITEDIKNISSNTIIDESTNSDSLTSNDSKDVSNSTNKELASNNDSKSVVDDSKKSESVENNDSVNNKKTEEVKETDEQILANSIVNDDIHCFLDDQKSSLESFRKSIKNIIKNNDFDNKKLTTKDVEEFFKNIKNNDNLLRNISALFYQIHTDDSDKFVQNDSINIWELLEYYNKNDNDKQYKLTKKELAGNTYYDVAKNNLLFAIMDYYLKNIQSSDINIVFIEGDIFDKKAKQKLQKYLEQIKYEDYCNTILKEKFDIMSEKLKEKVKKDKYAFYEQIKLKAYDKEFKAIKNGISVSDWNKIVGKDCKLLNDIKNFVLLFNKLQDNMKDVKKNVIPTGSLYIQILGKLDIIGFIEYNEVLNHPDCRKSLDKHKNVTVENKEDAIKLLKEVAKELGIKVNSDTSDDNKQKDNNNQQTVNNNVQNQQPMPNNQQMMQPMYPQYQQPMFNGYNPYMQPMMYNNYYQQPQYNPYYNNYYQQQQMMYNYNRQNSMYNNQQYYQNNNQMTVNNNKQNNNNTSSGSGIYAKPDAKFLNNQNTSIYDLAKK